MYTDDSVYFTSSPAREGTLVSADYRVLSYHLLIAISLFFSWVWLRRASQVESSAKRGRTDKRKCVVSKRPRWERARNDTLAAQFILSVFSPDNVSLMFYEYFKTIKKNCATVTSNVKVLADN